MDREQEKLSSKSREVILQKRLLKKASEFSASCHVPVAVVVYGPLGGEAERRIWPPAPTEAAEVFKRYVNSPDTDKDEMDLAGFYRHRIEKLRRRVEMVRLAICVRETFLAVHNILAGSYQGLDNLLVDVDLTANVMAVLQLRKKVLSDRIKSQLTPSQEEEPSMEQEEPSMAPPPAMANPPPPLLPAEEPPVAAVGGVDVNEPVDMDASDLLKKVAAIMADKSGNGVQPTEAEVDSFLRELLPF